MNDTRQQDDHGPRKPDFFIVGATKSGTTAMYTYLRQHPDVFMPELKECNYFSPDVGNPNHWRGEAEYLALFAPATNEQAVGEASPAYLHSEEAASRIQEFKADARILIMARNPVDRAYSAYHHRRWQGTEPLDTFEAALAADARRLRGEDLPPGVAPGDYRPYAATMRYVAPVKRYLDAFPRGQVKVVLFDDFTQDTAAAYADVCRFLGVDDGFRPEFRVVNGSKAARSSAVQALTRQTGLLYRVLGPLVMRTTPLRKAARALVSWNTERRDKPPMDPRTRARLTDEVRPEVEAFADLIGRDLSHWLQPPEEAEPEPRDGDAPRAAPGDPAPTTATGGGAQ